MSLENQLAEEQRLAAHADLVNNPPKGCVYLRGQHIDQHVYSTVRTALARLDVISKKDTEESIDARAVIDFLDGDRVLTMPLEERPNIESMAPSVQELYKKILPYADIFENRPNFAVIKDYFLEKKFPDQKPITEVISYLQEAQRRKVRNTSQPS